MKTICWFRHDLRIADHPALAWALSRGSVIPLYILEPADVSTPLGGASTAWLEASLARLNDALNGQLLIVSGHPESVIADLAEATGASAVAWNRRYEPLAIETDKQVMSTLKSAGLEVQSFKASLLWEPWASVKKDGTPYRVFTPFYKNALAQLPVPETPLPRPSALQLEPRPHFGMDPSMLGLADSRPWVASMLDFWSPGEEGAMERLDVFIDQGLADYKRGRDFPALEAVSRLSPHIHFGEISPRQIWYAMHARVDADANKEHFLRELIWREFSYHLLYHFPTLPTKNLQTHFDGFPWMTASESLVAWQKGMTGYPIVDAGMRELWATGYMHNRVRMIVGSFLVKNLLLDWRLGERWFWDCLVDADQANNSASWQWVAGCGADAAPYFRIFNPITQGEKFDPEGFYTRKWLPELARIPNAFLYKPWECPPLALSDAGVVLGETYPHPIVELKASRERALAAYQAMKDHRDRVSA